MSQANVRGLLSNCQIVEKIQLRAIINYTFIIEIEHFCIIRFKINLPEILPDKSYENFLYSNIARKVKSNANKMYL